MKLVGVTGKSGAGKTTLSNMLAQNENVGVIHVDELMDKVKEKQLSTMMENDEEGKPKTVKKNVRKFLYGNKYIFLMYIKARGLLLNKKIKEKIEELEKQKKEIAVIECVYLKYYLIFKELDKKVLVRRPYIERQNSVLVRDKDKNMDKEIFTLWDLPYKRSYYKDDIRNYEYVVDNQSKEQLEQVASDIYKDISEPTNEKARRENLKKYECSVKTIEQNDIKSEKRKEEYSNETR